MNVKEEVICMSVCVDIKPLIGMKRRKKEGDDDGARNESFPVLFSFVY